jgi:hypothetical protein
VADVDAVWLHLGFVGDSAAVTPAFDFHACAPCFMALSRDSSVTMRGATPALAQSSFAISERIAAAKASMPALGLRHK